ncbi:MAG: type-F conjugative transfer system pilin assembly protein TrbC, partial [Chlamydiales bacterium]|nr:type-F conjugative transfer system pilin assembly protein TrbC [Chlamydiales bacterium]
SSATLGNNWAKSMESEEFLTQGSAVPQNPQDNIQDKALETESEEPQEKPCCQLSSSLKQSSIEGSSGHSDNSFPSPSFNSPQGSDRLLVFVSFSMPLVALKNLSEEINSKLPHPSTTLVIRGLVENSFKKTGEKIGQLSCGVDINPKAFEEYGVTRVPTFILVRDDKEVSRISGNVSLSFANEKLQERS